MADENLDRLWASLGDEAVRAWREAENRYLDNPGTIIAHKVDDGLWFEWMGGEVAVVSKEIWVSLVYGMNDRGELPWLLCVIAIGPGGDYFVIRGEDNG